MTQQENQPQPPAQTSNPVSPATATVSSSAEAGKAKPKAEGKGKGKSRDITRALELMGDGVLVELHISRPAFTARLTPKDLGLEVSENAEEQQLMENFRLGAIKLLPKAMFHRLDNAEQAARKCLYRRSFEFGQSRFVPVNWFEKWEAENARYEAQFQEVAEEVLTQYEALCEELLASYRQVAERNWLDSFKRKLGNLAETRPKFSAEEVAALRAERQTFVEDYVARIASLLKPAQSLKDRFVYDVTISRIALPTELARDKAEAAEIASQQQMKEAELRAKLAQIKAEQDKAEAEVQAKRQVEREKATLASQAERERLQRELRIEQAKTEAELKKIEQRRTVEMALLEQYKERTQKEVDTFWNGILREINTTISRVTSDVSQSLDKNGKLVVASKTQLQNLLEKLAGYRDYLEDAALAERVDELRTALAQMTTATTQGRAKNLPTVIELDLAPLRQVLSDMRREAGQALLELDETPLSRSALRAAQQQREKEEGEGENDLLGLDLGGSRAVDENSPAQSRRRPAQIKQDGDLIE